MRRRPGPVGDRQPRRGPPVTRYAANKGGQPNKAAGLPASATLRWRPGSAGPGGLPLLALPGSAYIYQGEELGLPEVVELPDEARQDPTFRRSGRTVPGRDGCRVPLPWTAAGHSFGFSPDPGEHDGTAPWLPQPSYWGQYSVARQLGEPDSFLSLYRDALKLRRTHPALGYGSGDASGDSGGDDESQAAAGVAGRAARHAVLPA